MYLADSGLEKFLLGIFLPQWKNENPLETAGETLIFTCTKPKQVLSSPQAGTDEWHRVCDIALKDSLHVLPQLPSPPEIPACLEFPYLLQCMHGAA